MATRIASALRQQGHCVNLALAPMKPRNFFAKADAAAAAYAILLGPDDLQAESVRVKDLESRTETMRPIEDLLS